MLNTNNISIALNRALKEYIESQYHIRDETLIKERKALLDEIGIVSQTPYIEATPVYRSGPSFDQLTIPVEVRSALSRIAAIGGNIGIYPKPYLHQTQALEKYFSDNRNDLIVATGTGSGKTESFLMPILGSLVMESQRKCGSKELPGCRAILLYPMNALVNDQVSRIRRLVGNKSANDILSFGRNRPLRFGSYTGRTPYPGKRTSNKDTRYIEPLFEDFYNKVSNNKALKDKLDDIGRWPKKNLTRFYLKSAEEEKESNENGEKRVRTYRNWDSRLKTDAGDFELMTRHEMQIACPDILVTNYSMLEYMLLRPIEQTIFEQTAEWLKSNADNEIILVLDEAHMYRGAGGAEVALLIRRLCSRLGITRDRMRAILTSASLGDDEQSTNDALEFGEDLTGHCSTGNRFTVIRGTREQSQVGSPGDDALLAELSKLPLRELLNHESDPLVFLDGVKNLNASLKLSLSTTSPSAALNSLFEELQNWPVVHRLIDLVMGRATSLPEVRNGISNSDSKLDEVTLQGALDSLLTLLSIAKRSSDGRILMPTRMHMFFRGLPGLHLCTSLKCDARRSITSERALGGRLYTKGRLVCQCSSKSRVYEFLTHRDCGAAFIRGFVDENLSFLWSERENAPKKSTSRLVETEVLLEHTSHPQVQVKEMWLHTPTGKLFDYAPEKSENFRKVFFPESSPKEDGYFFADCPVCTKKVRKKGEDSASKIMDHITKGEAPFTMLVRGQMELQPATKKKTPQTPNMGRKVLIFSDGRQKAARLARDLPRDMELDLFRQVIATAINKLNELGQPAKPVDNFLYPAFLSVLASNELSMFDVASSVLESHITDLKTHHEGDLDEALSESWTSPTSPPLRYKQALLKLLCGTYFSLYGTTLGFVEPASLKRLKSDIPELSDEEIRALAVSWIQEFLSQYSFDKDIPDSTRAKAAGFWKKSNDWGSSGRFRPLQKKFLNSFHGITEDLQNKIESTFLKFLAIENSGSFFLVPKALKLTLRLHDHWFYCNDCTSLAPFSFRNRCTTCGSDRIERKDPDGDAYLLSRKSFWRNPVLKALENESNLTNLYAEEHTAQLSNRDGASVHSTTELHELRFQDLLLNDKEKAIDVLSCTTTMEVGIDIGSLVAVALRNIPPQRENYQQRAGRAGRRGSSISTVLAYSQNGPHDSHYFLHPKAIVAGPPRNPELKIDNHKIAKRHIHSYLFQEFYREMIELYGALSNTAIVMEVLGGTREFFHSHSKESPNLKTFTAWLDDNAGNTEANKVLEIAAWLPNALNIAGEKRQWIVQEIRNLKVVLQALKAKVPLPEQAISDTEFEGFEQEKLLEFLFHHSLLPSYAFPTALASFLIQARKSVDASKVKRIVVKQMPQQSLNQALGEYAPGRLVVINKETYRSGGVFAAMASANRAEPLFKEKKSVTYCDNCNFVKSPESTVHLSSCPVCDSKLSTSIAITPEIFGPEKGRALPEDDKEQDYTFATKGQFPQPPNEENFDFSESGTYMRHAYSLDNQLLTMNKGEKKKDGYGGFSVCNQCGSASVFSGTLGNSPHERPYFTDSNDKADRLCNGKFEQVFLWHRFTTDLLLIRLKIQAPLATNLHSSSDVIKLEAASYTIAEALRLAASRHPQLDLDPSEFGSGFRIIPSREEGSIYIDIYLYDSLSGGAGYSELASKYFDEIIKDTLSILELCDCDSSCVECLDHFHNQHLKESLNRHLGIYLLRYALYGEVPLSIPQSEFERASSVLVNLLELDGFDIKKANLAEYSSFEIRNTKNGRCITLCVYPSLLLEPHIEGLTNSNSFFCSKTEAERNTSSVHSALRQLLS